MFLPPRNPDLRTYGNLMAGRKTPPPAPPLSSLRVHWRLATILSVMLAVLIFACLL